LPNWRNFKKLSLQVAKDTGYWGYPVRQIGYKKKKLGTGKPPLAGDRKSLPTCFAKVATGKHMKARVFATPAE
jgi:hypothetical protein